MKKMIVALCIIAPLLGQVGVANAMPANEYICKVQTTSLQTGVVKVQANDESAAKRIAAQGNAMRLDGVKEQVKTVVQCIDFPQGRFQDPKLQAFVDAMPR
tara:strand:- start:3317 stop:3619 length:303 start_codon:yes stop_codon:yes gene_type:complete